MTDPKKLPIFDSLNLQEVDMSESKVREFWIYEGKLNSSPLLLVYKEQQKIKVAAPENFDEIHVIEHSAYLALQKELITKSIDYDAHQNLLRKLNEANDRIVEFEKIKEAHLKFQEKLQKELEAANADADHYKHLYEDLLEQQIDKASFDDTTK